VIKTIDEKYLYTEGSAWPKVREDIAATDFSRQKDVHVAIATQIARLRDSELNLLTPEEITAVQQESTGRKIGYGLLDFCIDSLPQTGEVRIVTPLIGSPAALAGLLPKDVILQVNHKNTRDLNHEQVLDEFRANSISNLVVTRGNHAFSVQLIRSDDPLQVISERLLTVRGARVGYIRIAQFTPEVAAAFRSAIDKLQSEQATAYVIDLRNNPGGFVGEATKIAGFFVGGHLGDKVRRNGAVEPIVSDEHPVVNMKVRVAVLINAGTASASEFVAGALHDRNRALLIGATTFGRGQAEILQRLPDNYGLIVPSALLRTPKGRLFKGTGLSPDVIVHFESMVGAEVDPAADPQLRKALAVIAR
jgi:carboxyl-terminal processing protease